MSLAAIPTVQSPPLPPPTEPLYVEISSILYRPFAGTGRFTARLLDALCRVVPLRLVTWLPRPPFRDPHRVSDLGCGEEIAVTQGDLPKTPDQNLDLWVRSLLERPRQPHDLEFSRQRACLFTMWRPDQRHFRREVGILYDATPLVVPWTHIAATHQTFGTFFGQTIALFDKAVAISHATKADASWLCALPTDDVVVGYPGPSLCVHGHAHAAPVKRRDNLILAVSTLEPRKNAPFLLDWFLNTDVLPQGTRLWWVGARGWWTGQTAAGTATPRPGQRFTAHGREVEFLGSVSDKRLCELYQEATFTIYPSLYEGFGFPVLDSLLHGTPVLTSFNSSLQEFMGPGVFYFDPYDKTSLDRAYQEVAAALPLQITPTPMRELCSWDALARTVLSLCSS